MTMTPSRLMGLHHLSAMSSHAQDTIDFYAGMLGLPLLKQTVNYDDPGSYHLYFGDPEKQIGTMTFFVWPGAHRGQVGRGGVSQVSFPLSSSEELGRWESWLTRQSIPLTGESCAGGGGSLRLEDPDGLRLELTYRPAEEKTKEMALSTCNASSVDSGSIGLAPIDQVTVMVSDLGTSMAFYERILGLNVALSARPEPVNGNNSFRGPIRNARFNPPAVVLEQSRDTDPKFRLGAGLAHHFALQTADLADLIAWRDYLNDAEVATTDIMDRSYFKSIYLRDPDGQVVEIATTGPGLAIDESQSELGQHLALPPWLEDQRAEIVSRLPSLISRPTAATSRS